MRGYGKSALYQRLNGITKQLAIIAVGVILMLSSVSFAAAQKEFYSTYTPKSELSSFFYIDVFCKTKVTAAVFEIQFDDSMVSYDSAAAVNTSVTLRNHAQSGKVKLAFAALNPTDGQLCRLSFRALQAGEVSFVLHMEQAAGANRKKLPQMEDDTLIIKLGKDDIAPTESKTSHSGSASSASRSSSASRASSGSRSSSASSYGGKKSFLEEGDSSPQGGTFDLREDDGSNSLKWLFIGAGIILLVGLLIFVGIVLDRRIQRPKKEKENPPSNEETDEGEKDKTNSD